MAEGVSIEVPLRLWRRTYPVPLRLWRRTYPFRGTGAQGYRGTGAQGYRGTGAFAEGDHPKGVRGDLILITFGSRLYPEGVSIEDAKNRLLTPKG